MSDLSEADIIRQKRLARLQSAQVDRSPDASAQSTSRPSVTTSKPELNKKLKESLPTKSESSFVAVKDASGPSSSKRPPAASTPRVVLPQDFDAWEESTLSKIFRFTLNEKDAADAAATSSSTGSGLRFLQSVYLDLKDSNEQRLPRLSTTTLDSALLSKLTEDTHGDEPFQYLIDSFKQINTIRRTLRIADPLYQRKTATITEAKRLCSGYAVLTVTMPFMFAHTPANPDLARRLLQKPDSSSAVPPEFVDDMITRAAEDETLHEFISPIVIELSSGLARLSMVDNYQSYFAALQQLVAHKPVAQIIAEFPNFVIVDQPVPQLEERTILGPFFAISPVVAKVADTYFANANDRPQSDIDSALTGLRTELRTIQDELFFIIDKIVRASSQARERVLQFFALAVNLNHKRRAIQVEPGTVSSDAFMINITAVLTRLCEPFVDASFAKIDKIDPLYFRKSTRIDIKDEVKLDTDQQHFDEYYAQRIQDGPAPNFISEVFYLTVAAHHYGLGGAMNNQAQLSNDIKELEKHLKQLQDEQPKWANSPQAVLLNNTLDRVRKQYSHAQALQHAFTCVLRDRVTAGKSYAFLMTLATWLMRIADPNRQHPQKFIKLPLPADSTPEVFKNLPEYFVEDITGFLIYYSRNFPDFLFEQQHVELVAFSVTFLNASHYIKNPYLKSKIIEVLFYGTYAQRPAPLGYLGETLTSLPYSIQHLFHSLMSFYIEIESTGASSQFYDKFNIRYYISQIVKCIWQNTLFRDKLEEETKLSADFFVRFVALLLNDVTYLLDESLSKLTDIHNLQIELSNNGGAGLTPQERTEKQNNLVSAERQATSYMSLANETVSMLKLFTKAVPAAFVTSEIVDRLAAMLDYNLDALVGPKCTGLKVKDPQKYQFNPKVLLSDITDVYLNLSGQPALILAIARDGRSYRRDTFARATQILTKYAVKSSADINRLVEFADQVELTKQQDEQGEEELGDIPDEFLDPLMYTLMENPVVLPSSKVTIDLATIKSHLLSDSTDPFNRVQLRLQDVIPNVELKQKINEFKSARRKSKLAITANAQQEEKQVVDNDKKDADGDITLD
ncbi:ubiquitin elongating factor core-domain-containing protein [Lipomyces japonicus]|uniref:ubiquitin elongating factor core-domain-containing protein n=1 Tax=Lipomyces japonicus TaxID=56871 RepID=UPI0034D0020C